MNSKYKIILNDIENKIFNFLKNMIKENNYNITLRVAGGWVRDKLLGKESNDIDISIDNCMGEDFANYVKNYLIQNNFEIKHFGLIKSNPEKCKHLETATISLFGQEIDFVNLRSEEYLNNTRIPDIKFGTPEEDALRRDFTINSLFYNINEDQIEDFTKMGLNDLENKIIRTPLDPKKTFSDDPLRILRAFRFISKLNYKFDEKLVNSLKNNELKEDLINKVSNERVGIEFIKSLKMKYNYLFLEQLKNFEYEFIILGKELLNYQKNKEFFENNLTNIIKILKNNNLELKYIELNKEEYIDILVLSVLLYKIEVNKNNKKKKEIYPTNLVIKNNLKLTNKLKEIIEKILKNTYLLINFCEKKIKNEEEIIKFLSLWLKEIKNYWEIVFILYPNNYIFNIITKYNLQEFYKTKLLMNGNEINKEFKVEKQDIKKVIDEIIIFQGLYKDKTKEDFINYYNNKIN